MTIAPVRYSGLDKIVFDMNSRLWQSVWKNWIFDSRMRNVFRIVRYKTDSKNLRGCREFL